MEKKKIKKERKKPLDGRDLKKIAGGKDQIPFFK